MADLLCGDSLLDAEREQDVYLQSEILVDQDKLDSPLGKRFFSDRPGVADPIRTAAVFAEAGFHAWHFLVKPHGVDRGRIVFDPCHGIFHVGDDLVPAGQDYGFPSYPG